MQCLKPILWLAATQPDSYRLPFQHLAKSLNLLEFQDYFLCYLSIAGTYPYERRETKMEKNEIQDLKNQLAALQNQINQLEVAGDPERASRRGMLKLAAGAAVGAVAGGLALSGQPASAGSGYPSDGYFFSMTPQRVYDSRWTNASSGIAATKLGRLSKNESRVISVKDGRDSSGRVTTADLLPFISGFGGISTPVQSIAYNLTVTQPSGSNYLSLAPGDATTTPATSSINFWTTDVANSGIISISADRELKVFCGDNLGGCHFILDITGFYQTQSTVSSRLP